MNTSIVNRISMMLVLAALFAGSQSFVQDDTTAGKTAAPATTDTTVKVESVALMADPGKKVTAETKIRFNSGNLAATDAEVYNNFIKEFTMIDFSFLRQAGEKAEAELIGNFNKETFAPFVRTMIAGVSAADAESVENFRKAQPRLITWNPSAASLLEADNEIVHRFNNEFAPKVVLSALSEENLRAGDVELMQQFNTEFGQKKEGIAHK